MGRGVQKENMRRVLVSLLVLGESKERTYLTVQDGVLFFDEES